MLPCATRLFYSLAEVNPGLRQQLREHQNRDFQNREDRYERGGTIIVSQLPVSKWHEYIAESTILDRLIPKAHKVDLKGKSLRKRSEHVVRRSKNLSS